MREALNSASKMLKISIAKYLKPQVDGHICGIMGVVSKRRSQGVFKRYQHPVKSGIRYIG